MLISQNLPVNPILHKHLKLFNSSVMQSAWFWHVPSGQSGALYPKGTQCFNDDSKNVPGEHGMLMKTSTSVQMRYELWSDGLAKSEISGALMTSSVHGLNAGASARGACGA